MGFFSRKKPAEDKVEDKKDEGREEPLGPVAFDEKDAKKKLSPEVPLPQPVPLKVEAVSTSRRTIDVGYSSDGSTVAVIPAGHFSVVFAIDGEEYEDYSERDEARRKKKRSCIVIFDESGEELQNIGDYRLTSGRVKDTEAQITSPVSAFYIDTERKYLVFCNPGKSHANIVFLTRDKEGRPLEPRNWTREEGVLIGGGDKAFLDMVGQRDGSYIPAAIKKKIRIAEDRFIGVSSDAVTVLELKNEGQDSPTSIFVDGIKSVNSNICVDPKDSTVIYYCSEETPKEIWRLDTKGDPKNWRPSKINLPAKYRQIKHLQFDPTGNFLVFNVQDGMGEGLVVVLERDTLKEVYKSERSQQLSNVHFNDDGEMRAMQSMRDTGLNGSKMSLVRFKCNFEEAAKAVEARRVAEIASSLGADMFGGALAQAGVAAVPTRKVEKAVSDKCGVLKQTVNDKYLDLIKGQLTAAKDLDGLKPIKDELVKLRGELKSKSLSEAEVEYVVFDLEQAINEREKAIAKDVIKEKIKSVRAALGKGVSLTIIADARQEISELDPLKAFVDDTTRGEVRTLMADLQAKAMEIFSARGAEVGRDLDGMMANAEAELKKMKSKTEFDDWVEYKFPALRRKLGELDRDCPAEAHDIHQKIMDTQRALRGLADQYEREFKMQYAEVREAAKQRTDEMAQMIKEDIAHFIDRLRTKKFSDVAAAEAFVSSSEAKTQIESSIESLQSLDADMSKELMRFLKVNLSNLYSEIERGAGVQTAESGQQMVAFGKFLFPKWEGHVQKKVQRRIDVTFVPDAKTKGPGVGPAQIYGDIGFRVESSRGRTETVRLYQGFEDEDEWKLGLESYFGAQIPPAYVTAGDYQKIQKDISEWMKGDSSKLRQQNKEMRDAIYEHFKGRLKDADGHKLSEGADFDAWKGRLDELMKEYGEFCAKNNIVLCRRAEHFSKMPEAEYKNGKGYVPEWQNHWVADDQTEAYLEDLAKMLKMQGELQEGMALLKGHAGTGKDVLVKMFCSEDRANRPYFAIDCTKWTTEAELSEDITLEAKDGASQTVKVPSVVLNAITTPGAVMYFNEFNAMPESAQIFLHALMDEKRSLTLKTQSGKTVKTHPSVLLIASMNPGYPGTFEPQFATRSRTTEMEINYPPLTKTPVTASNPIPDFSAAEALRIARGVSSLEDFTYEPNMSRNEFVKIWDEKINSTEGNGAPQITPVQEFDLNVILALVQFGYKLREDFMIQFSKGSEALRKKSKALPVKQPLTGREMRRCAYELSNTPDAEKMATGADAEAFARRLISKYFLSHIDSAEDRAKIEAAMKLWTTEKRHKI